MSSILGWVRWCFCKAQLCLPLVASLLDQTQELEAKLRCGSWCFHSRSISSLEFEFSASQSFCALFSNLRTIDLGQLKCSSDMRDKCRKMGFEGREARRTFDLAKRSRLLRTALHSQQFFHPEHPSATRQLDHNQLHRDTFLLTGILLRLAPGLSTSDGVEAAAFRLELMVLRGATARFNRNPLDQHDFKLNYVWHVHVALSASLQQRDRWGARIRPASDLQSTGFCC